MSTQIHKQNRHKGPRQHFLNKVKFDPDKYKQRNISKSEVIRNCCERCVKCILWKVDYGKYKELRNFSKCHRCDMRNIELPYHKLCHSCAENADLCAKCEKHYERIKENVSNDDVVDISQFPLIDISKQETENFSALRILTISSDKDSICDDTDEIL